MLSSSDKKLEKLDPFYRPSVSKQKTSAEIISEARNSLREIRTQRPFTPQEDQRKLFGPSSSRTPENRPPSSFSLHASSFESSDSKPISGARLSPLELKPKAPASPTTEEGPCPSFPKPPVDPVKIRKISSARARLFRAASQGTLLPDRTLPPPEPKKTVESKDTIMMGNSMVKINGIYLTEPHATDLLKSHPLQLTCDSRFNEIKEQGMFKGAAPLPSHLRSGGSRGNSPSKHADMFYDFCSQSARLQDRRNTISLVDCPEKNKAFCYRSGNTTPYESFSDVRLACAVSEEEEQVEPGQMSGANMTSSPFCLLRQDLVVRIVFILGNLTAKNNQAREQFSKEKESIPTLLSLFHTFCELDLHSEKRGGEGDEPPKAPRLRAQAQDVLIKLTRVLANLAIHPGVGPALAANPHVVDLLLTTLENKSIDDCEELVINTTATINNLSYYQVKNSMIQDKKLYIAELLLKLLVSNNMDGILEAVRVFGNLSQDRDICDFIVQKNIHKFMIALLDAKHQDVCFSACGVLLNLTVDKERRVILKEGGGIKKLVDCLRDFGPTDWQLACLVCKTLWNFSENITNASSCFGDEDSDMLLTLLSSFLGAMALTCPAKCHLF
ncbi:Armadillo repeat-containing protein 2 [Galemys pyrenaicus]|uniref:Armadillo repeat-containing protein 2 n=1 Tax=Galemys pyrenaicus TaxID=202257 RepID=A0A8J6AI58_GALPY|nr:Armadillo repeat-containing protein 2 [Galemys pyrenaicus]